MKSPFPQLQVLLDHPVPDPQKYLHSQATEEEALSLMPDPKTGLPAFLPNNPKARQELKMMLDRERPPEEQREISKQSLDHQIESALDLLSNIKDTTLSRL